MIYKLKKFISDELVSTRDVIDKGPESNDQTAFLEGKFYGMLFVLEYINMEEEIQKSEELSINDH